jgi:MFS family permease
VVVAAFVVGTAAYDEYFPLVARDHRVATSVVPWLIGLTVLGQVVGTALAGRTAPQPSSRTGWTVVAAGVLISVGVLVAPWAGFAAIAVGYGLLNNAMVVTEARLQQVITGPARATVTSVMGLGEEVVALSVYAAIGLASGAISVPVLVALLGVPTVVIGLAVRRWLPEPPPDA